MKRSRQYGLIGYPLSHSFSQKYFTEKFAREGLSDHRYDLFEIEDIGLLGRVLEANPELRGFNVTIPYKERIIPWLHWLEDSASRVGAVNTVKISRGRLSGYNTDYYGFLTSLAGWLPGPPTGLRALVLGSGGAAKAVTAALDELGIGWTLVSRQPHPDRLTYRELAASRTLTETRLLINTTPVGMYPRTGQCPDLPYEQLSREHYVYDLIYNPGETLLLQRARQQGAATKNGLEMLHLQAERAWEIWQQ